MSADAAPEAERLQGRAEFALAALSVARVAQHELLLLTYAFESALYGSESIVEAIKAFALAHERATLKVLINQPRLCVQGGHRLIELGRRLPSRIQFRELLEERTLTHRGELLIADRKAVLERNEPDALFARQTMNAPLLGKQRGADFDALWEESPPATELRVLGL